MSDIPTDEEVKALLDEGAELGQKLGKRIETMRQPHSLAEILQERDLELSRLRTQVALMREALLNAKGFFCTPITRRRYSDDPLAQEAMDSIETACTALKQLE